MPSGTGSTKNCNKHEALDPKAAIATDLHTGRPPPLSLCQTCLNDKWILLCFIDHPVATQHTLPKHP